MNPYVEIENTLERMGNEWPVGDSLVDSVLRRIEQEAVCVEPRNVTLLRIKSFLAIAASLAVVAGLWWALSGGNTLYAQVVDAIQRTRTLHMTATVQAAKAESAQPVMESWYERGVGFRETVGSMVHLGNQKNFWTYVQDSNLAIRSESHGIDDVVNRMLDNEFIKALQDAHIERDATGDEVVDGQPCRAYLLTNFKHAVDPAFKSGKIRLRILLDDQSRLVRAFLEDRSDDRWVVQLTTNWKYDVPVDRAFSNRVSRTMSKSSMRMPCSIISSILKMPCIVKSDLESSTQFTMLNDLKTAAFWSCLPYAERRTL